MRKLVKSIEIVKQDGPIKMISETLSWFLRYGSKDRQLQRIKARISKKYSRTYDNTIQFGPFKSMKFTNAGWGNAECLGMLLGVYELEVQDVIELIGDEIDNFIDVGAASGFYAVGVLVRFPNVRTIAFESSEASSRFCMRNAILNGVSERIDIRGNFFGQEIPEISGRRNLFLFDIEGGEYQLVNQEFINKQSNSHFIIELHGRDKVQISRLIDRFKFTHNTILIDRQYSKIFRQLNQLNFPQNIVHLIASEGRDGCGSWLLSCPKQNAKNCRCSLV